MVFKAKIMILAALVFFLFWFPKITPGSEKSSDYFSFDWLGKVYIYSQSNPKVEGGKNLLAETEVKLTYQRSFSNHLYLNLSPCFQIDNDHKSEGVVDSVKDNEQKRRILDLREGFLEYKARYFDYFVGQRIFSWGKGDYFNPADRINPRDYTDFLDSKKMGVFSTGFKFYPSSANQLELCLIPFFNRSRIYLTDSRWASCSQGFLIKEDLPKESQYALRYSLYLKDWDLEMSYMKKIEDLPCLMLNSPNLMVEKHRRVDLFSIEGTTTAANKLELHAGIILHEIKEINLYGRFIQYLAGLTYTFDQQTFFNRDTQLSCEYLGKIDLDQPDHDQALGVDLVRIFENSLFTKIQMALGDFSDLRINNLFSLEESFNDILRLEYAYKYSDSLELGAGVDFIWGDGQFVFEQFDKNDRTYLSLKYLL